MDILIVKFADFFATVCVDLAKEMIEIARKEYKERKERDKETVKKLKDSINQIYDEYIADILDEIDEEEGLDMEEIVKFFSCTNETLGSLIESLNQGRDAVKHISPKEIKKYEEAVDGLTGVHAFIDSLDMDGDININETAEKLSKQMRKYEDGLDALYAIFK